MAVLDGGRVLDGFRGQCLRRGGRRGCGAGHETGCVEPPTKVQFSAAMTS